MIEKLTITPSGIEHHRDKYPQLANRKMGNSALVGLQLFGDRKISSRPYVKIGTEDEGHYIKVKGPSDAGQIVETEIPLNQALNSLSHKSAQGYTKPESRVNL